MKSFWNGNHELSEEKERIWNEYVPDSGSTKFLEINLFLAANRLLYDAMNNGWGCNNYTGELDYLKFHGYFNRVQYHHLAEGEYEVFYDEGYFDSELVRIIKLVQEFEGKFTEDAQPYDVGNWGLSNNDFDKMMYDEDEDDY